MYIYIYIFMGIIWEYKIYMYAYWGYYWIVLEHMEYYWTMNGGTLVGI